MLTLPPPKLTPLLQELHQELHTVYGDQLIKLILFGSHARNEANEESDIDILIVLEDLISPGDEILRLSALKTDLNLKYNELISVTPISNGDYQNRSTPLLVNIWREGIIL